MMRAVLTAGSTGIYAKPTMEPYSGLYITRDSKIHYNWKQKSPSLSESRQSIKHYNQKPDIVRLTYDLMMSAKLPNSSVSKATEPRLTIEG
jgi:hypothetical protein